MIQQEFIEKLINEKLADSDKFLVSVKVKPGNCISVYIDGDKGVTIDDCASVSKFIESNLNREAEDFELEVSSAGISHPLVLVRQYIKNIGREIKVKYKTGIVITGMLQSVENDFIVIAETANPKKSKEKSTEPLVHQVNYSDIKETKLIIKV